MDWNDEFFKGKPKKKDKEKPVVEEKQKMLCYTCGKPVFMFDPDRCKCSIWDYGKKS